MQATRRYGSTLIVTAVLAACGGEARMTIDLPPADRLPGLSLRVEDRDGRRVFTHADLSETNGSLSTGEFEVAGKGPVRVAIHLEDGGTTVADGALELQGREEFRWFVAFVYDTRDPAEACFGCRGSVSLPVAEAYRTSPDEALWGVWAGHREGSDVVY